MKTLEELIKFSAETEQEAYVMRKMAAEILRVAEERCIDHYQYAEGLLVNHDNPEDAWGEVASANDLLELIRSYING